MAVTQRVQWQLPAVRPLTKEEIDRRIERIHAEVLAAPGLFEERGGDETLWVSTAELVRRMQPFLSDN
jgi:hypothetical protein